MTATNFAARTDQRYHDRIYDSMATKMFSFFNKSASAEEAFKHIDVNGDGVLSVDELMEALIKSGAKDWPRSRVAYIVAKIGKSGGATGATQLDRNPAATRTLIFPPASE